MQNLLGGPTCSWGISTMLSAYCEMAPWSTASGMRRRRLMLSNASDKIPAMHMCFMFTTFPMPHDLYYKVHGGHQASARLEMTDGVEVRDVPSRWLKARTRLNAQVRQGACLAGRGLP